VTRLEVVTRPFGFAHGRLFDSAQEDNFPGFVEKFEFFRGENPRYTSRVMRLTRPDACQLLPRAG